MFPSSHNNDRSPSMSESESSVSVSDDNLTPKEGDNSIARSGLPTKRQISRKAQYFAKNASVS